MSVNHLDQSQSETLHNKPKQSNTREQIANARINRLTKSYTNSLPTKANLNMDAHTINNLELADSSEETIHLIGRWRDIVDSGVYRQSGGRWKKYHEPRFLRNETRIIEAQLQIATRNVENRQREQPIERRNEQWTMDPFWEVDHPQRQPPQLDNEPGPSSRQIQHTLMGEGEIDSEADQDPSVLEVPAVNWAKYIGVKSVQYIKIRHAPKVDAEETNDWDLGNALRETGKHFSTNL